MDRRVGMFLASLLLLAGLALLRETSEARRVPYHVDPMGEVSSMRHYRSRTYNPVEPSELELEPEFIGFDDKSEVRPSSFEVDGYDQAVQRMTKLLVETFYSDRKPTKPLPQDALIGFWFVANKIMYRICKTKSVHFKPTVRQMTRLFDEQLLQMVEPYVEREQPMEGRAKYSYSPKRLVDSNSCEDYDRKVTASSPIVVLDDYEGIPEQLGGLSLEVIDFDGSLVDGRKGRSIAKSLIKDVAGAGLLGAQALSVKTLMGSPLDAKDQAKWATSSMVKQTDNLTLDPKKI